MVCRKVAILGGWIGLEVFVLGLDLLEVEDLGFHRNGVLKDLVFFF